MHGPTTPALTMAVVGVGLMRGGSLVKLWLQEENGPSTWIYGHHVLDVLNVLNVLCRRSLGSWI